MRSGHCARVNKRQPANLNVISPVLMATDSRLRRCARCGQRTYWGDGRCLNTSCPRNRAPGRLALTVAHLLHRLGERLRRSPWLLDMGGVSAGLASLLAAVGPTLVAELSGMPTGDGGSSTAGSGAATPPGRQPESAAAPTERLAESLPSARPHLDTGVPTRFAPSYLGIPRHQPPPWIPDPEPEP